ncbi:MAG TPA: FAD-binding oxidoreductase [Candidatus Methylomirabilis sp.]|nr:FAD-binding oxidoreductase [Candidatus Methylomirabilis sp.]
MRRNYHPWGTPPWTIDFRPAKHPLPARVDFAVIGAGFAGLSAAAHLAKLAPSKSVLVFESSSLGHGASGRTGGIALADTAVGPLPGLGNVLTGYKKILRDLLVESRLTLPGVYELAHSRTSRNSPISWSDSGDLRVVRKVPGGAIDPGKVLAGLARAAQEAGAQILEHAEVRSISAMRHRTSSRDSQQNVHRALTLHIRLTSSGRSQPRTLLADQVLLTTNAGSLKLSGLHALAQPKLTLALATAPLKSVQLRSTGLSSRRPFYTVDLPYLWGRLLENNGVIFGAGLVPRPTAGRGPFTAGSARSFGVGYRDLLRFDIHKGAAAQSLKWLEARVRNLHPAFETIRVTHRWGGPILLTKDFRPVFRHHPRDKRVFILAGFSGHGVALSVYLGRWAAQSLLGLRPLPRCLQHP